MNLLLLTASGLLLMDFLVLKNRQEIKGGDEGDMLSSTEDSRNILGR